MPPFALYLIKHYFIDILERIGVNGKMNQNWSNTLSENYEKKIRVTKQHPKCTIEASYIVHHPILSGFPLWLFDPNGLDGSRFPTRMPNLTRPTRPTRPPFPTLLSVCPPLPVCPTHRAPGLQIGRRSRATKPGWVTWAEVMSNGLSGVQVGPKRAAGVCRRGSGGAGVNLHNGRREGFEMRRVTTVIQTNGKLWNGVFDAWSRRHRTEGLRANLHIK